MFKAGDFKQTTSFEHERRRYQPERERWIEMCVGLSSIIVFFKQLKRSIEAVTLLNVRIVSRIATDFIIFLKTMLI
jgi:hypothetical protein